MRAQGRDGGGYTASCGQRSRSDRSDFIKVPRSLVVIKYAPCVTTTADGSDLRHRLYRAYASQHAGHSDSQATSLVYRRDIRRLLPGRADGPVLDIGCGQGHLVNLLLADGYTAQGVDISQEQVALARAAGLTSVHLGDYREVLTEGRRRFAAVVATDLLEHLTKEEVLDTFDRVIEALTPVGVFVARVPNAVSPLGGHIRHGDVTHESWYTASSIRQLAAAAGFCSVAVYPCVPVTHGLMSAARTAVWRPISAFYKIALAAETGVLRGHVVTQNMTFAARKAV
jgi:2-polyprenyl-3-methyl-5-hydroxy-6-metoxy-1,4-benzoquinol methylase